MTVVIRLVIVVVLIGCVTATAAGQSFPKREMRAAWIATVMNIDWPSNKGLSSTQQQQEYIELLDKLHAVGMNAVIVQIRPTADAFYPSSFEPWSEYLTGAQGVPPQPYYNPLNFMIDEARKRGMEFHAWFNPYRVSMNEDFIPAAGHPFTKYPDWFVKYGGKWYYDPGHPDARAFVLEAIMETIRHYDVDAVHFDDYFYPYRIKDVEFPDDSSFQRFGQLEFEDRDSWRRSNVDYFIRELSLRIANERSHVKFGISPFGVWRNIDMDTRGSKTQAGQTNYDDLFADVLKWLAEGWIDYVTPQIYWHIGFDVAEYKTLVDWWSRNAFGRHVYIGQGIYRVGGKGWEDPNEIVNQIAFNRTFPNVHGSMYFSAKVFAGNKRNVNQKIDSLYRYKALVPVMEWKTAEPSVPPQLKAVSGSPDSGLRLTWSDSLKGSATYYVIYRFKGNQPGSTEDAEAIAALVPRKPSVDQHWTDTKVKKRTTYTYVVRAANRLHEESAAGNALRVRTRGKRANVRPLQ